MPTGFGGGKGFSILFLVLLAIWLMTGIYRVNPQQQGVVMRFGEWVRTTPPGLHYHLPTPIENVLTPDVTRDNRIEIGYRSFGGAATSRRDVPDESKMITGDENNIDIDFIVFWKIADAGAYLFNIQDPPETVKVAAQSVMRDIIGQTKIQTALTGGRQDIQLKAKNMLQDLLNEYEAGVEIRDVQLLSVNPPSEVIDAFNDVQRARQDRDTLISPLKITLLNKEVYMTNALTIFDQLRPYTIGYDNIFEHFNDMFESSGSQTNFPPYDIIKYSDTKYDIQVAIAGYSKEDIVIEQNENTLSIKSIKQKENDKVEILHRGISKRHFEKYFTIADDVKINGAELKNGLLKISLERIIPEQKKPKTIKIN
jgi:HflK protein